MHANYWLHGCNGRRLDQQLWVLLPEGAANDIIMTHCGLADLPLHRCPVIQMLHHPLVLHAQHDRALQQETVLNSIGIQRLAHQGPRLTADHENITVHSFYAHQYT